MDIKRPPKWKRVLRKTTRYCLLLAVSAVATSFAVQQWKDRTFSARHPAPGSFVTVEGHRMHYRLRGEGAVTFVLEAGLGDYSGSWGELETGLAGIGRVFVYDRAGLGWSEEGPGPRTPLQITTELHAALQGAGIRKPYILVGHSLGGLTQTLYALRHPEEVAGLLLIDPAHKDQMEKMPGPPAAVTFLMRQLIRTAPLGLPQLVFGFSDPVKNQTRYVRTSGEEMREIFKVKETWGDRPISFGRIPIYVLTAGELHLPGRSAAESKAIWEIWKALHDELLAASTSGIRSHEIVAGASHYIHRSHPAVVVEAARELVSRIKARAP